MHATSVLSAVQLAATAVLVGWMFTGFTSLPGKWLRWKMFCRARFTIITLDGTKDGRTEPVNPYRYLSPGSFLLSPERLQAIITHLTGAGRYDRIDGRGRVLSVQGEQPIEVSDSVVR
ncbi:hypothetical protein OG858_47275 (plasmid) [Streptomyces europaeiscabiei]|uniref:hypothetical protein n=1 Tax=Streptomyces europaeiscabiei TaxID=146819 RepID=UPI002E807AF0|nr:hypothetical protein [Streptomyces europaeiscabiei]WUD38802.1 hypothetical protein OG858_47275 [Streptomyces europaeiscabiei]